MKLSSKTNTSLQVLNADKVILSTGAGTAQLLARGASGRPDLQSENRITAAAVVTGIVRLTPAQMSRFEKCPVFVHAIEGVLGEWCHIFL